MTLPAGRLPSVPCQFTLTTSSKLLVDPHKSVWIRCTRNIRLAISVSTGALVTAVSDPLNLYGCCFTRDITNHGRVLHVFEYTCHIYQVQEVENLSFILGVSYSPCVGGLVLEPIYIYSPSLLYEEIGRTSSRHLLYVWCS